MNCCNDYGKCTNGKDCAARSKASLGLKRGLNVGHLSDEKLLELAEPFGEFQHADAQGHKRIAFARAVLAAAMEATK